MREGEPGSIVERESPIHHSNAMLYSTEQKVASRIGYKCALLSTPFVLERGLLCVALCAPHRAAAHCCAQLHVCWGLHFLCRAKQHAECVASPCRIGEDGKKVRYLKKTGEVLP